MDKEEALESLGLEFMKVMEVEGILGFSDWKRKRGGLVFFGVLMSESERRWVNERVAIRVLCCVCFSLKENWEWWIDESICAAVSWTRRRGATRLSHRFENDFKIKSSGYRFFTIFLVTREWIVERIPKQCNLAARALATWDKPPFFVLMCGGKNFWYYYMIWGFTLLFLCYFGLWCN